MRSKKKKHLLDIVFVIVLLYAAISLYPLIWVVLQSFKTETEFLQSIWTLPGKVTFENYLTAFWKGGLLVYIKNSARNTICTVFVDVVFVTCAGYAFSKLKMKGKKFFWYMILFNMLIPTPIIIIPMYLQIIKLGIQNTLPAIVFPYYQGFAPMGLILITNYMDNIPNEIMESARIDGCGTFRILFYMMIPLVKSMLVTLAILGGMSSWNEYLWALVSISDTKKYTLSIGIANMRDQTMVLGYTPIFAALTVSAMIFILLYLCAQKTFVRSIVAGAVKG
ncbi:MAG: carbohydrate ABC transporter permease [Lachnospiraceae bacterium]|nr:carbohydrate ABC transporter permease [Lachnospiraceae bacterium]